jgi:hypothetical protein
LRAIVSEDEAQIDRELFVLASLEIWMRANVDTVSKYPPLFEELVADDLLRHVASGCWYGRTETTAGVG